MPVILIVLKLIINSLEVNDAKRLIIANGCLRMIVLYLSLLYNVMEIDEILSIIYEPRNISEPLFLEISSNKHEEMKKEISDENNILMRIKPSSISSKRGSFTFLNENSQTSGFPLTLHKKVKLPIFISFDLTMENTEKGKFF